MGSTTRPTPLADLKHVSMKTTPTSQHPFFDTVWRLQHTLNEHSPLLREDIRAKISDNFGCWPAEMKSYEAIRKALDFERILVNFSGNSTITASSVNIQQVYYSSELFTRSDTSNFIIFFVFFIHL